MEWVRMRELKWVEREKKYFILKGTEWILVTQIDVCVWPFLAHFHFNLLHFASIGAFKYRRFTIAKWKSKAINVL